MISGRSASICIRRQGCGRSRLSAQRRVRASHPVRVAAASRGRAFAVRAMRWRGLEPPRGINPTRPSTLRVYQFRHQRAAVILARRLAVDSPLSRDLLGSAQNRSTEGHKCSELDDFATFSATSARRESVAAVFDYLSPRARALRQSSVRGPRRRSLLRGRAHRAAAKPVGRDAEPAGRPARRRRERGDRRPGARRRRLGLRVRQRGQHARARVPRRRRWPSRAPRPAGTTAALAPVEPVQAETARRSSRTPSRSRSQTRSSSACGPSRRCSTTTSR